MSGGVEQQRVPLGACSRCLSTTADERTGSVLHTGCGCKGALSHAHVSCLVALAKSHEGAETKINRWHKCPWCEQPWSGAVALALQVHRKRHLKGVVRAVEAVASSPAGRHP